ncbi:MAG: M28 family peptidase [Blastocatellia bacterium]|nr:M28 family peptidase [Blastocatellia bacterium]
MFNFRSHNFMRAGMALLLLVGFVLNTAAQSGLSKDEKRLTKSINIKTIQRITSELSDDKFEGRGTLQRGGDMAASWIADQMRAMGLKPLGDNGTYLQSMPLVETVFTDETNVSLDGEKLVYGKDWSAGALLADMKGESKLVFVGHGMVSDELGRNDLKDVDLKGKIAVLIDGPPLKYTAEKWKEITDKTSALPLLIQRGAVGVLLVGNGRELYKHDFIVDQTARRNIATIEVAKQRLPLPIMFLGDSAGAKLFAGSGMTKAEAMDDASDLEFQPMNLKPAFKFDLRAKQTEANSHNVVGYIEGSDPILKNEAIVFTAHYDGFGKLNGKIYNAAADNAIGNGEMLAVAEAFSKMKVKPKRSLVFVSTTSEEYGLLGGYHFAKNPKWDITKVAANLNLDGIGTEIMGPIKNMVGFGAEYSSLGAMFNDVARAYKITPMEDPIPEQGVFGRSDHYPFVTRGVPALMLVGSPEATKEGFVKRFNEFEETKYHQPSDDVYKDWYWPGAKTVADMMGILGYRIAQADSMPTWLPGNKYSKLRRGDTLPQ